MVDFTIQDFMPDILVTGDTTVLFMMDIGGTLIIPTFLFIIITTRQINTEELQTFITKAPGAVVLLPETITEPDRVMV